jgi:16S rRNA (uracil1498-N3)-methyltransferase
MNVAFAAAAPAVAHVFVDDVEADGDVTIAGDDGHHLQRVRRLRPDEAVTTSDGRGEWRLCRVRRAEDGHVVLTPDGPVVLEPELVPRLTIAFAPAKGDQAGTVVHQLVELGVDRVMPVTLARSVVRWDGTREERVLARLRRIAREAAMQSRRARLPEVLAPEPLEALAGRRGLVVASRDGRSAADLVAAGAAFPGGTEFVVLTGPEGGFAPSEEVLVASVGRLAVGPHVMRAVTAPVAAAAAIVGFRRPEPPVSDDSGGPGAPAGARSAREVVDKQRKDVR